MRAFIFILCLFIAVKGSSQSTNIGTILLSNQQKGDHFYSIKAYRNALPFYQRMIEKGQSTAYAKEQIADCYYKLYDLASAEEAYASLIKEPNASIQSKIRYAQLLCVSKRYDEAADLLDSIKRKATDSVLLKQQIYFLKNIKSFIHDEDLITVQQAKALNSPYSDFGATYYKDEVVFASTRDNDLFVKRKSMSSPFPEESLSRLFSANNFSDGAFGPVRPFKKETFKPNLHDGPIAFYDNSRKAAITSSNLGGGKPVKSAKGITNVKLYLSEIGPLGSFRNVVPFPFNSEDYSVGHACFSENGKRIYFSANYPNGFGGSDIYYSDLVEKEWTPFVNAGPTINTSGDEMYPFVVNDTTFYFATNGHGGFGGLDIYTSKLKKGKFSVVRNLGFPVNSSNDDFAITTDSLGRNGFITSSRPFGTGQDDIYSFVAHYILLEGYTRQLDSLAKFIPEALIVLKDDHGAVIDSVRSNELGKFEIKLPFDKNMSITAMKKDYSTLNDIGISTIGQPFGIDSLLLPLEKQKVIIAKGKIYSNETEAPLPNAVLLLRDLGSNKVDTVVLGNNGEYLFKVLPDHKYRIEATKEGFIPNGFNLNTQNINKTELLNDIVVEEVYVEKAITYFDYNKYAVKHEWKSDLNKILRTLKRYPETTLHVGAHADSRGAKQYNQGLSERRAQAVVDYFVANGVDKGRITAVGFGEELILNRCSDGVVCPEEEHSKNRRAELKVQRK